MESLHAVLTWWRLSAAIAVLMLGYVVSRYATEAAQLVPASPTPAVIIIESTPILVVVTATTDPAAPTPTPAQQPERAMMASPDVPLSFREPRPSATRTLVATPTQGPTRTPVPPAPTPVMPGMPPNAPAMTVAAQLPLAAGALPKPAAFWSGPQTLWLADSQGLTRVLGPTFGPVPPEAWQQQSGLQQLMLDHQGQMLVARTSDAATPLWVADLWNAQATTLAESGEALGWAAGQLWLRADCTTTCALIGQGAALGGETLVTAAKHERGRYPIGPAPMLAHGTLAAFRAMTPTTTLIVDQVNHNWWYLGGWQDATELHAIEEAAAWMGPQTLLTFHRSAASPTIAGHGLDVWQWDVRANSGRFFASDVAALAPAPDQQSLALILLGEPALDAQLILTGGYWRPETPVVATLAVVSWPSGRLLWSQPLAEHPPVTDTAALDGWAALQTPVWAPDSSALVALDNNSTPRLFPGGTVLLPTTAPITDIAWAPDSNHLALVIGQEAWLLRRESAAP